MGVIGVFQWGVIVAVGCHWWSQDGLLCVFCWSALSSYSLVILSMILSLLTYLSPNLFLILLLGEILEAMKFHPALWLGSFWMLLNIIPRLQKPLFCSLFRIHCLLRCSGISFSMYSLDINCFLYMHIYCYSLVKRLKWSYKAQIKIINIYLSEVKFIWLTPLIIREMRGSSLYIYITQLAYQIVRVVTLLIGKYAVAR